MAGRVTKQAQLRSALTTLCAKLRPGEMLPSERQLCDDYRVSRMTVREVLGQLESEGVITRVPGKGTFVAERVARSRLHMASFSEDMRRLGRTPSTVVLHTDYAVPPPASTTALSLNANEKAFHLVRLRLADGLPISIDDGWYRADLLPGLLDRDLTQSLYSLMANEYDCPVDRADQTVRAVAADERHAGWLGTDTGSPLLAFDRMSYSRDRCVEHAHSWYRADRYQVYMTVSAGDNAQPQHDLSSKPIELHNG
ncbi:GntR family transcriptional regulator [Nocardia sp. NPDC127526]|uniref:GntR family transcriptional regulator n=1 Tax=Nocardia sp. NPDC127526 TaxID=3345393 RepID=UPI00363260FE